MTAVKCGTEINSVNGNEKEAPSWEGWLLTQTFTVSSFESIFITSDNLDGFFFTQNIYYSLAAILVGGGKSKEHKPFRFQGNERINSYEHLDSPHQIFFTSWIAGSLLLLTLINSKYLISCPIDPTGAPRYCSGI